MINVFIGYDPREAVAFSVLAHSIQQHASEPVSIAPIRLSQLQKVLTEQQPPVHEGTWVDNLGQTLRGLIKK